VDGDDVEEPLANEMDWTTALKAAVLHEVCVVSFSVYLSLHCVPRIDGNNLDGGDSQEGP